jgi:hypothetical protein
MKEIDYVFLFNFLFYYFFLSDLYACKKLLSFAFVILSLNTFLLSPASLMPLSFHDSPGLLGPSHPVD